MSIHMIRIRSTSMRSNDRELRNRKSSDLKELFAKPVFTIRHDLSGGNYLTIERHQRLVYNTLITPRDL